MALLVGEGEGGRVLFMPNIICEFSKMARRQRGHSGRRRQPDHQSEVPGSHLGARTTSTNWWRRPKRQEVEWEDSSEEDPSWNWIPSSKSSELSSYLSWYRHVQHGDTLQRVIEGNSKPSKNISLRQAVNDPRHIGIQQVYWELEQEKIQDIMGKTARRIFEELKTHSDTQMRELTTYTREDYARYSQPRKQLDRV